MPTKNTHSFMVGKIACIALLDTMAEYPVEALVANVAPGDAEPALARYGLKIDGKFISPYLALFIKTDGQNVLVDTGCGDLLNPGGKLLDSLQEAGISPDQIDAVIISHAHGDHVGGNTDKEGKIQFPNARWVIAKDEWEFWTKLENIKDPFDGEVIQRKLLPVSERMQLVQGENEIAPGVFTIPLPGHTPGHQVIAVRSEGEELIYAADAMLHPIHVEHPDWCASDWADLNCEGAIKSRQSLYERAASTHSLVLAFHFLPFPGFGHIVRVGEGWQWAPLGEE